MQEKIEILNDTITNYSLKIKEGDRVLITYQSRECHPLVKELIKKISESGGICFTKLVDAEIEALLSSVTTDERIKCHRNLREYEVNNYDCFITICYATNDYIGRNVKSELRGKMLLATSDLDSIRTNERRWVLLNYPSPLDAYKSKMTNEEFRDYAFDVMTLDYKDLYQRLLPLKELMEKTDEVRIVSPGTDLTFSIKNMPVVPCCGESNIPDGEIFTAPVKTSVNGTIKYNTPSPYHGNVYNDVTLTFKDGKIINATCNGDDEALNKIFDTDEGARYVGEFSFGLNPKILNPMGDILFDEKIIGSIHFTPGKCYDDADNGNNSTIHWDMVLIQRKEYGGGEIYFDHTLIRKDGLFVLPELKHLNYNLL